ncbi:unnamed protein product [Lepeophtheirus salmonis]|uniref:(salmon louse) hypothetical protein n=1 Tax=Lepeophtheirus salmonis TaxID=72036 RepID=A0A7R8CSZ5_LEPSM|nr:unnamed protein product [Lepeophtheirus salmonis]CAF2883750.1 unnamed protein product [Lepeophtheirus salmonis]
MVNYTCEVCGEICCGEESMRFHVLEAHVHGHISCPYCDLSDISANEMKDPYPSTAKVEGSSSGKELDCPLCPFKHVDEEVLSHHGNNDHFGKDGKSNSEKGVSTTESTTLKCPFCTSYEYMNQRDLSKHMDSHLSKEDSHSNDDYLLALRLQEEESRKRNEEEMKNFNLLKRQYGMQNEGSFAQQSTSQMERAKSELSGMDDASSVTFDILPTLRKLCSISNDTQKSYFCSSNIDHYGSSYGIKDGANARSILSKFNLISSNDGSNCVSQSICTLQKGIEKAWKGGYDSKGAEQLGGKLHQTRKWIGATEIVAFFTAHQIRTQIFDFHSPSGSNGTHPILFKWVLEYFRHPSSIETDFFKDDDGEHFTPPLYLQHQGHSRTIILVIPIVKYPRFLSPSNSNNTKVLHLIRKNINSIKSRQYQIVAVTGTYSSEQEASLHKTITSSRIS